MMNLCVEVKITSDIRLHWNFGMCCLALHIYRQYNQSILICTPSLAKGKLQSSLKILKVKIRVLAAWNNHRAELSQAAS